MQHLEMKSSKCKHTFSAHARHKTTLVATVLTTDATLLGNVTVAITLTSECWFTIFSTSDVKTLKIHKTSFLSIHCSITSPISDYIYQKMFNIYFPICTYSLSCKHRYFKKLFSFLFNLQFYFSVSNQ